MGHRSSIQFVDLLSSHVIVVHHLEPDDADPVTPVVLDVLGPGSALHVDELARPDVVDPDRHQRRLVTFLLEVREVVAGEACVFGEELQALHSFLVSGELGLAAHPDPECGAPANQSRVLLPPGLMVLDELVEDEHAEGPEPSKAGVVDDVEDSDEEPRHRGPAHDGASVLVVHEPGEGLPAMSLDWLDGRGPDRNSLIRHLSLVAPDFTWRLPC